MSDIEMMARLWNVDGMSQSQIGRVMGLSASAVAGKIFRNRDLFPKRQKGQRTDQRRGNPSEKIATASQKANERRKAFHAVKVAEDAASAPVAPVEPEINGKEYDAGRLLVAKELLPLKSCECAWPLNDGGPFIFCAAEVVTGSPYCAHHKARSKGKGTISEQRAIKDARWAA